MAYAKNTTVSIDRSMGEVRGLLLKNSAQGVAFAETPQGAIVSFYIENFQYKFNINYPQHSDNNIKYTNKGTARTVPQVEKVVEDEKKRLWRAMVLYIKSAIEAHNNGIIDLKRSLMGNLVTNDGSGKTLYQVLETKMNEVLVTPSKLLEK